jgi:hypothetical protein
MEVCTMTESKSALEVRQPRDGEVIHVNPDPAYRKLVTLLQDDDGTYYLLGPKVAEKARKARPERARLYMLRLAQNADGVLFLWPVEAGDIQ